MPINLKKYPPNWSAISERIRKDRARGQCECRGQCGYHKHLDRCTARAGREHPATRSNVVLTVAHWPDPAPHNVTENNLHAMCQQCHLALDAPMKGRNLKHGKDHAGTHQTELFSARRSRPPILFTDGNVRRIMRWEKTQTRRIVPFRYWDEFFSNGRALQYLHKAPPSPYGKPGDDLWVREAWNALPDPDLGFDGWLKSVPDGMRVPATFSGLYYRSDMSNYTIGDRAVLDRARVYRGDPAPPRWIPSIHMYRWASRLTLRVVDVRLESLLSISGIDAYHEGIRIADFCPYKHEARYRQAFFDLWDEINADRGYPSSENPWVYAINFYWANSEIS